MRATFTNMYRPTQAACPHCAGAAYRVPRHLLDRLLNLFRSPDRQLYRYRCGVLMCGREELLSVQGKRPVRFNFRDDPGFMELDNVAVMAVPEPETYVLMLAGMGALLGARRLRRRGPKSR